MTVGNYAKSPEYDVAIIGGGASGMACALFLFEFSKIRSVPCPSIVLIEKNPRLGKKLLLTGNGRCNLTNRTVSADRYHGDHADYARYALSEFGSDETLKFFEKIGLQTFYDESGKAFPESLHASSVLDCMRFELEESGTEIMLSVEIESIKQVNPGFVLYDSEGRTITARYLVVACGGAASPFTGSDGNGYRLLESLGHTMVAPLPGIVQIKTDTDFVKSVSGIKITATASLLMDATIVRSESGEILFTDFGLSGPPILQLSGLVSRAMSGFSREKTAGTPEIRIDFMSEKTESEVCKMLRDRRDAFPQRKLEQMLVGIFHNRLAIRLLKSATEKPMSMMISTLSDNEIARLASSIKRCSFRVTGVMPLTNAQVTIGGARTDEFEAETMRSLICDDLYACGEVLDIDGDCGGYNLQWAWSSAYIAARSITRMRDREIYGSDSEVIENDGGYQ